MSGIIPDKLFLTSNLRLWQIDAVERFGRPFKDVHGMNKEIIERWNDTVSDDDLVFVLGNFALDNPETVRRTALRLRGFKSIILGDIDRGDPKWWVENGWQAAMRHSLFLDQANIILSHRPLLTCDYFNFYGRPNGAVRRPNHLCVSTDDWDFRPMRLSEMLSSVGGIKTRLERFDIARRN